MIVGTIANSSNLRVSERSRLAEQRVSPVLKHALETSELCFGSPIFIRIFKKELELEVWVEDGDRYKLFRTYPICAVSGILGPKTQQGDLQAPEGFYFVTPGRMNPYSRFYLSFDLGYPNAYDRFHGCTGGDLMVHGDCVSIGCFAMTNPGIEEIYALAVAAFRNGQPYFRVHIFPFRMTFENLADHSNSPWREYWDNLKEGNDLFLLHGQPPNVELEGGKYVFDYTD